MALALIVSFTLLPLAILALDLGRKRKPGAVATPTNLTVSRPAIARRVDRGTRRGDYVPGLRYPTDGRSRQAVFGAH